MFFLSQIPQLLQQVAPPPSELPATIQAGLALVLLAVSREVPKLLGAGASYVNVRIEERRKKMEIIDKLLKRIDGLEVRVDELVRRADEAFDDAKASEQKSREALALAQKASTELTEVQTTLNATLEDNKTMTTLIEALKMEKKQLEDDRNHWKSEAERLAGELTQERDEKRVLIAQLEKAQLETGDHPAVKPDTPQPAPDTPNSEGDTK